MLKDQGDRDGNGLPESNKDGADASGKAEGTPENLKIDSIEEQISISGKSEEKYQFSRLKRILLVTGAVLAVLLVSAGIYLFVFYKQIQETQQIVLNENTSDANITIAQEETVLNDIYTVFPEHIVNIALLGFDRGWDREARGHLMFRPDVQALISIDFDRDQISVIRILRDSYVPIHDAGGFHDKINHAYQYGYYSGDGEDPNADGINYTLLTMSNVLGNIPIHYYISVDMYSIIALVNALGGIYYNVEEEIVDIVWVYGVLLPPIPAGPQVLDGTNYLRYLQYRDSKSKQDYGRIERQTNLLRETYQYLRENSRISDIPVVYRIYKDYVDTDLSYKKISALANYFMKVDLTEQNMHFYTLGGASQMKDGIYYEVISQEQRLEIIKKVFGMTVEPWPPIVLKDSPEYTQEQERKRRLEEGGNLGPQFPSFDDMKLFENYFN